VDPPFVSFLISTCVAKTACLTAPSLTQLWDLDLTFPETVKDWDGVYSLTRHLTSLKAAAPPGLAPTAAEIIQDAATSPLRELDLSFCFVPAATRFNLTEFKHLDTFSIGSHDGSGTYYPPLIPHLIHCLRLIIHISFGILQNSFIRK